MPFKFGVDSSGNYGYIKAGADTVTPFLTRTGNATETNVLSGKTFSNASSSGLTGTMTNNGGATKSATYSLDSDNSRVVATIPANGYYNTSSKLYATYATVRSLIGLTAAKIVKGNTILGLSGTAKAASNLVIETNIYGHNANFNETVPFKYTNNKYAYLKIEYAGYMGCTVKGDSTKIFNQAETEYLERSAVVNISKYSKITVTGVKSTGYTMANIKLTFSNSKPS